jgi:hypothetical protein
MSDTMDSDSRPPSPPLLKSRSASFSSLSMGHKGYFSYPFERFMREESYRDRPSAFTLLGAYPPPARSRSR